LVSEIPPRQTSWKKPKILWKEVRSSKLFFTLPCRFEVCRVECNHLPTTHLWKCKTLVVYPMLHSLHNLWLAIPKTWEWCCKLCSSIF
jgi:hypothetical protein